MAGGGALHDQRRGRPDRSPSIDKSFPASRRALLRRRGRAVHRREAPRPRALHGALRAGDLGNARRALPGRPGHARDRDGARRHHPPDRAGRAGGGRRALHRLLGGLRRVGGDAPRAQAAPRRHGALAARGLARRLQRALERRGAALARHPVPVPHRQPHHFRRAPRAEGIEFDGLGHLGPITHPERVDAAVEAFLSERSQPWAQSSRLRTA